MSFCKLSGWKLEKLAWVLYSEKQVKFKFESFFWVFVFDINIWANIGSENYMV